MKASRNESSSDEQKYYQYSPDVHTIWQCTDILHHCDNCNWTKKYQSFISYAVSKYQTSYTLVAHVHSVYISLHVSLFTVFLFFFYLACSLLLNKHLLLLEQSNYQGLYTHVLIKFMMFSDWRVFLLILLLSFSFLMLPLGKIKMYI